MRQALAALRAAARLAPHATRALAFVALLVLAGASAPLMGKAPVAVQDDVPGSPEDDGACLPESFEAARDARWAWDDWLRLYRNRRESHDLDAHTIAAALSIADRFARPPTNAELSNRTTSVIDVCALHSKADEGWLLVAVQVTWTHNVSIDTNVAFAAYTIAAKGDSPLALEDVASIRTSNQTFILHREKLPDPPEAPKLREILVAAGEIEEELVVVDLTTLNESDRAPLTPDVVAPQNGQSGSSP